MESIGVKIQVDGGKEFKAELENIKQTSKALSAELKNVVGGLDSTGDQAEDTKKKMSLLEQLMQEAAKSVEVLTKKLDQQEANLAQMNSALAEAKSKYGATSPEVQKLTTQITRQETEIAKTKTALAQAKGEYATYDKQLNETEGELEDVADASKKAGDAAEDAGKDAEKAGKGGWTIMGNVLADLAASAIQAVWGALKDLTKEAIAAHDSMDKFAQTMSFAGYGADEIEGISAAIKKYADDTVYDLDTIASTVAQLGANGVDNFEALTEAAGNLNAVAGGNAQTFESVASVLTQTAGVGKLTTENWKQLTGQIPGAAGVMKQALLEMGAYEGSFEEALSSGAITAEEFNAAIMQIGNQPIAVEAATSAVTFEGAIGNLQATVVSGLQEMIDMIGMANITGAINSVASFIGSKLIPAVKLVVSWLQEHLTPIIEWVGGFIADTMIPIMSTVWNVLKENIIPVIMNIVGWLKDFLLPIFMDIVDWIKQHIIPYVVKVIELWGTVWPAAMNALMGVLKPVANFLKTVLGPVFKVIAGLIGGVIDAAAKMAEFFKKMTIKIPEIKLPHFTVKGKFSLNPLEVPHLGIDWYDKGGIFRQPSIIGVGERRPEFVGALDDLRMIFREEAGVNAGVTINVYANDNMNVEELAEVISDKIQAGVMRRSAVYA